MAQESGAASGSGEHLQGGDNSNEGSSIREQDRFLPIANVGRVMKRALPANAKISKDAKETVQECVSEFISFITGEASDKCQREKRKTVNGDDILWAMSTLGFDDYIEPLKLYLAKYREMENEKGTSGRDAEEVPSSQGGAAYAPATQQGYPPQPMGGEQPMYGQQQYMQPNVPVHYSQMYQIPR